MVNKKTICKLLIGCFCLSMGSLALANENAKPPMPKCGMAAPHDWPDEAVMERHETQELQKLVNQNTITGQQSAQLSAFFKEKAAQRKADMEKMKDMSPEERHAYLQEKFKQQPDMISEIKNAANLSEEQAQIVASALRPPHGPEHNMAKYFTECLNKLVKENTLTQDQADKIISFFKQKAEERKADMEKAKNMSAAERDAFFKDKMSHHPDFINDLKTAAGLTDEQAKTVANALRPPHHPGYERHEPPMYPAP